MMKKRFLRFVMVLTLCTTLLATTSAVMMEAEDSISDQGSQNDQGILVASLFPDDDLTPILVSVGCVAVVGLGGFAIGKKKKATSKNDTDTFNK